MWRGTLSSVLPGGAIRGSTHFFVVPPLLPQAACPHMLRILSDASARSRAYTAYETHDPLCSPDHRAWTSAAVPLPSCYGQIQEHLLLALLDAISQSQKINNQHAILSRSSTEQKDMIRS